MTKTKTLKFRLNDILFATDAARNLAPCRPYEVVAIHTTETVDGVTVTLDLKHMILEFIKRSVPASHVRHATQADLDALEA